MRTPVIDIVAMVNIGCWFVKFIGVGEDSGEGKSGEDRDADSCFWV